MDPELRVALSLLQDSITELRTEIEQVKTDVTYLRAIADEAVRAFERMPRLPFMPHMRFPTNAARE